MRRWHSLAVFGALFAVMLIWWATIDPQQDRAWADDVAQPLHARIEGDRLIIDTVRNFHWRTETDYDVRWEAREYDLSQVQSVDMILSYWMGPAIAHTLVSFGFADGRQNPGDRAEQCQNAGDDQRVGGKTHGERLTVGRGSGGVSCRRA